jgi:hypothetical protein
MAITFEYIRREANKEIEDLDKYFRSAEMQEKAQFKEDVRINGRAGALGKRIYAYERAERDVSFGTQRRYAVLTESHTGVIHFVSLFYAFLRCAAAGDSEERKVGLADALETALKLKALAETAEAMVRDAESSGLLQTLANEAWQDLNARRRHTTAVMGPLFAAYRKKPAGRL